MHFAIHSDTRRIADTVLVPLGTAEGQRAAAWQWLSHRVGVPAAALEAEFDGAYKSVLVLFGKDGKRYVLAGIGDDTAPHRIARALRYLVLRKRKNLGPAVAVWLGHVAADALEAWAGAVAYGLGLGLYRQELLKTDARTPFPLESAEAALQIVHPRAGDELRAVLQREWRLAQAMHRTFDLVNTPSNIKTPAWLAEQAVAAGRRAGFEVHVFDEDAIGAMGLHALKAVGQGSGHPPRFIAMEYRPAGARKKVALVGKGITFDTGGVSLKPANNMHLMKSDMGGAAAVIGTMEAAAILELPVHLVGVVPAAENAVDGRALKPGDVIRSYSGKTIEVIDTDAEGRLVLADALAWAVRQHHPDFMVDLATLTGSCIRALGTEAAGLFTPNDALAHALEEAGRATGERLWRLPLWDEYMEYLKTDVADIKNLGDKPMAGAITAAKFLEFFTEGHPAWAHIDMAGTALANGDFSRDRTATGFGVRLLCRWLQQLG